jgi:hypothetical protein
MDKGYIAIAGLTLVVLGVMFAVANSSTKNMASILPRDHCVEHGSGLGMHIHPVLSITIDGKPVVIPAQVGITASCMKALHTHDETGTIHIEYTEPHDFMLEDFFANWGQPFSKDQILDKKVDDTHTLTMMVDGKPSTDFEKLILKDEQVIEIRYEERK